MGQWGIGLDARRNDSPARIIEEVDLTRTGHPDRSTLNHQRPRGSFRLIAYNLICAACKYPFHQA